MSLSSIRKEADATGSSSFVLSGLTSGKRQFM